MIDKKRSLWIYNKMNEIRNFELKALELFEENKLRGSVHLYTGEEAVAASVCAQLTDARAHLLCDRFAFCHVSLPCVYVLIVFSLL